MFSNINEALSVLMQRTRGTHPQLNKFKHCMDDLGQPQNKLKVIHITGTNGKGSTTNYIRSICQKANYKVGTFTSPHLVSHHDRFRINNQPIDDETLLRLINKSFEYWDKYDITMFEIDVLIATWYFIEQEVDLAIYEVGMGGRYDATNIVTPMASVITNVTLDHTNFLGSTTQEIASEKAGIIKESGLVITAEKDPLLLKIFFNQAQREIIEVKPIEDVVIESNHVMMTYRQQRIKLDTLALYQTNNAALAFEVCYQLNLHHQLSLSLDDILDGLEYTAWAGRFEVVSTQPLTICDGAHNSDGMTKFVDSIQHCPRPIISVFAALKDKDTQSMLSKLMAVSDQVIVTQFDFYRVAQAEVLATGFDVIIEPDYHHAIELGKKMACQGTLAITGSLYFISEVRPIFKGN